MKNRSHIVHKQQQQRSIRPARRFGGTGIRPIRDVAVAEIAVAAASSEHQQGLRPELAGAKTQVLQRKVIDRAKELLMQRHTLVRQVAGERLRKRAINRGLRLSSVARRMLNAVKLLGYQSFSTYPGLNICALTRCAWALF